MPKTKVKKVYKYGTGFAIPKGAVYLCTKVQIIKREPEDADLRYVWHYFLVEEVEENK